MLVLSNTQLNGSWLQRIPLRILISLQQMNRWNDGVKQQQQMPTSSWNMLQIYSTFAIRAWGFCLLLCLYYTNGNEMKLKQQKVQWASIMFDDRITNHWFNRTALIFRMPLTQVAVICKFIDCGILLNRCICCRYRNKWFYGTLSFIFAFDFCSAHHRSKTDYAENEWDKREQRERKKKHR